MAFLSFGLSLASRDCVWVPLAGRSLWHLQGEDRLAQQDPLTLYFQEL